MHSHIFRKSITLVADKPVMFPFDNKVDLDKTEFSIIASLVARESQILVRFEDKSGRSFQSYLLLPSDGELGYLWDTSMLDFTPAFTHMIITSTMDLSLEITIKKVEPYFL